MKTVFANKHIKHCPAQEFYNGRMVECSEKPSRADNVHKELIKTGLGEIMLPRSFPHEAITRVHASNYVDFLKTASAAWAAHGLDGDVFATNFNSQHHSIIEPRSIDGKAGFFLADTSLSVTHGTWEVVEQSAHSALTALELVLGGEGAAFSLSRPPGHHASKSVGAGYCFLNNAAIAAQAYLDKGFSKVAILDVDYHHGNGTQSLFYDRKDVLYCSLHADPAVDFPYFLGYREETGIGDGMGFNQNYPLSLGTDWNTYTVGLEDALRKISSYGSDILIVSLGVDTYINDPISGFRLQSEDYLKMGSQISAISIPTLFVMEGGYAIDDIGINMVNVLKGFLHT